MFMREEAQNHDHVSAKVSARMGKGPGAEYQGPSGTRVYSAW
jgi:hypothetical protein